MSAKPSLYLLYGKDDAAIEEALQKMLARLGDAATGDMNAQRFNGPPLNLDDLRSAAFAMPFLTDRRLVIVEGISKVFSSSSTRDALFALL